MRSSSPSLDRPGQLITSDSASDLSRDTLTPELVVDTATANSTQTKYQQKHYVSQQKAIIKESTIDDIHKRSHSLRSHNSQNTSSNDTHDSHSPFESALARSGSWTSTTPTSPERELSQALSVGRSEMHVPSEESVLAAPSHSPLQTSSDGSSRRNTVIAVANAAPVALQAEKKRRLSGLSAVGILASTAAEEKLDQESTSSVGPMPDLSSRKSSLGSSHGSISNRNKPLPIPIELAVPQQTSSLAKDDFKSSSPIPTLSVSRAATPPMQAMLPIEAPPSVDSSSPTYEDDGAHKNSLRSMLNKSSKLFRASTSSRRSSSNINNNNPTSKMQSQIVHLSPALLSDSSLPWHQRSSSPSPTASQANLSSTGSSSDRSPSQFELQNFQFPPGPSKVSPPISVPPRSHSPFTFRRRSTWLGNSKLDYLHERHLKAPTSSQANTSQPSSSASSSASHDSVKSQEPKSNQQSSTRSRLPTFRHSRFSYHPTQQSKEGAEEAAGSASTSILPAYVAEDTIRSPKAIRPALNRNRSKSVDVLQRFKDNLGSIDLHNLSGLKGGDSVAIGTTSIIEVESPPVPPKEDHTTVDKSLLSRLLTRKPSVAALKGEIGSRSYPASEKEESVSMRQTVHREGTISRLTESLRNKKSTSAMKSKTELPTESQGPSLSKSDRTAEHCRKRSSDMESVFVIAQSTSIKADDAILDSTGETLGAQGKAWWGRGGQVGESSAQMKEADLKSLKAARLAAALSAIDEPMAAGALLSSSSSEETPSMAVLANSDATSTLTTGDEPVKLLSNTRSEYTPSMSESVQSNMGHSRRRTMSFNRLIDPFRGKSRPPSPSKEVEKEITSTSVHPSRNESSEGADDFASANSHTPSSSNLSCDMPPSETKMQATNSPRPGPPSSYRGPSSDTVSKMTKSESAPVLIIQKAIRSASVTMPSQEARNESQTSFHNIARRMSFSTPRTTTVSKSQPLSTRLDSAVSDTEDEPLPPPRSSSRVPRHGQSSSASKSHQGNFRRPSLMIDTKAATRTPFLPPPVRPSSALGMTADLERGAQRFGSGGGIGGRAQHRPSQPTLSIADDSEFLQALEDVRRVNQDRIKKQEEEASRIQQMARMGMASGNKRAKASEYARVRSNGQLSSSSQQPSGVPTSLVRRSSSADGRLSSVLQAMSPVVSSEEGVSPSPSVPPKSSPIDKPSALEMGVGKASGKFRDGTFLNDDDWKREVKALFVIRELVLTERSYARHLEALLQAVRALYPPSVRRQMSTGSTLSRSTIAPAIPPHIALMRTLLPQLIALSRSLANRIDENPTAAGVGAAFRLVGNQMEATFVAWSSVAKDIMDALRISEKVKSKAKNRIGLITLESLDNTISDEQSRHHLNGFASVPASPTSVLAPRSIAAGTPEKTRSFVESPTSLGNSNGRMSTTTTAKRRSTLSAIPPSFTANLRAKATTEANRKKLEELPSTPSPTHTSQSLGRRAMGVVISSSSSPSPSSSSSSRPPLPSKAKSSRVGWDSEPLIQSLDNLTSKISTSFSASTTPTNGPSSSFTSKKLGAMDVAIMPTQRLPRYLLLLRDLNANTPPQSLSHVRLQRSFDFVKSVASSCDRASKGGLPSLPRPRGD